MGQVRTLKAQLETNYDISITSQHPIIPWLVRHTVYLLNRYATHADGNTGFYRRWNKEHRTPLCEFGETVLYQLPHVKDLPKLENRFLPAIWRGKDTATGETLLGIATTVVRSRTIKRQPMPEKYNKQLMDIINNSGLNEFPTAIVVCYGWVPVLWGRGRGAIAGCHCRVPMPLYTAMASRKGIQKNCLELLADVTLFSTLITQKLVFAIWGLCRYNSTGLFLWRASPKEEPRTVGCPSLCA